MYKIFFLLIFCSFLFQSKGWAKDLSSKASDNKRSNSCDKELTRGVSYIAINAYGENTKKIQLRFAPFEIPSKQQTKFTQFSIDYEKKYGKLDGIFEYNLLRCRFFFGSYTAIALPIDVDVVKDLLERCPLKTLDHIMLAPGPIADCAPGVVHCHQKIEPTVKHPFDKIPCVRQIL